MKAWLLVTLPDEERTYRGNTGYDDDPTRLYRYDSNVPNSRQLNGGDIVVIRDKTNILGSAFIQSIRTSKGTKTLNKCPVCGHAKLKRRKTQTPAYRCECGEAFDQPVVENVACDLYEADFGNSFALVAPGITKNDFWALAPRLNKQFAILELDPAKTATLLAVSISQSQQPEEFPISPDGQHLEGSLRRVFVNKYERNPKARAACLAHYGCRCTVCGMDFASIYGKQAKGVIHVHHLIPLSTISAEYHVNPITDLRPVCPNCHVVVHLRVPPFAVDEVKQMLLLPTQIE